MPCASSMLAKSYCPLLVSSSCTPNSSSTFYLIFLPVFCPRQLRENSSRHQFKLSANCTQYTQYILRLILHILFTLLDLPAAAPSSILLSSTVRIFENIRKFEQLLYHSIRTNRNFQILKPSANCRRLWRLQTSFSANTVSKMANIVSHLFG